MKEWFLALLGRRARPRHLAATPIRSLRRGEVACVQGIVTVDEGAGTVRAPCSAAEVVWYETTVLAGPDSTDESGGAAEGLIWRLLVRNAGGAGSNMVRPVLALVDSRPFYVTDPEGHRVGVLPRPSTVHPDSDEVGRVLASGRVRDRLETLLVANNRATDRVLRLYYAEALLKPGDTVSVRGRVVALDATRDATGASAPEELSAAPYRGSPVLFAMAQDSETPLEIVREAARRGRAR